MNYRVVDTDNFNGDYPDEKFVTPCMSKDAATAVCYIFNAEFSGPQCPRYYKVVTHDYELQPGFEP